jgi:CRP/FNR family transcriptional regulator, cyclic AMP receptor protein
MTANHLIRSGASGAKRLDKVALLGRHPLFAGLDVGARERLAAYAVTRKYERGATIFQKGSPGSCLFAVASGVVRIGVPSSEGRDAVFSLIGEGDIFGEIALLDAQPRTADAQAFTDCELMLVDRRHFMPLLEAQPKLALKIIEVLCARLRRTSEQVEDLMFLDMKSRLVKSLLRLSATVKPTGKIAITQRELSQIAGLSREETNKQLRIWAKDSWVRLERGGITVLRPDALAAMADANHAP